MPSGAEMIRRGLREAVVGVGVVIDTGLERAADALDGIEKAADNVYDKVSKAANGVLDEIERAAARLAESADEASPKIITQDAMIKASDAMGRDRLGLNTWDWLGSKTTQQRLRDDYNIELRRTEGGGFFAEDLKRLVQEVEVASIPRFGEWKLRLLTNLTMDV